MEEVITQLENIDLDEEILITLESFSEYSIFENEEIVVPDSLFENEDWKIPHHYLVRSQQQISQNFCYLWNNGNCFN